MSNNKNTTTIERIIAKIDNDFNPDNSEWILRVGSWVHDALGLLDISNTERVKERFEDKNRIAYSKCELKGKIKVYDYNGCEIKEFDNVIKDCKGKCGFNSFPSTGNGIQTIAVSSTKTTAIVKNNNPAIVPKEVITKQINGGDGSRYNIMELYKSNGINRNYILIDCKHIELNFDTDCIIVEHDDIKMCHSDIYNCDFPEIPNNAKVIEYLVYYCMYKMLCRGYKHQVFNLSASQYGTNPYYIYKQLEDEAKRSYINDGIDNDLSHLWRSGFFIGMFDPRN